MNIKELNEKAIQKINTWAYDGTDTVEDQIAEGLAESILLSESEEEFKVNVIALYKFTIEGFRPPVV